MAKQELNVLSKEQIRDLQGIVNSGDATADNRKIAPAILDVNKGVNDVVDLIQGVAAKGTFEMSQD